MAIFGHIKDLLTLSPVMKRSIKPMYSLPTQKHFMVKFECQIKKWKYLFESRILPYEPNKTLPHSLYYCPVIRIMCSILFAMYEH